MYLAANSAIIGRLSSNWNTTAIITDNMNYEPTAGTSWIYAHVDFYDSFAASLGAPHLYTTLYRGIGNIEIDIFTPINESVGLGLSYADIISTIFRGEKFDDVICFSPTVLAGREVKFQTGNWWQTPLVCQFECNKPF